MAAPSPLPPSPGDEKQSFDLNLQHGHRDLVQAVAFNTYGDRCATGSVDGKIRVFNRHKDGTWRLCDTWSAHGGEVIEVRLCLCNAVFCLTSAAPMAPRYDIPQPHRLPWH